MNNILANQIFYSKDLHNTLYNGRHVSESESENNVASSGGIYLLSLRILKKDSNIIVYNYVYYPEIFVNFIIGYLIIRKEFKNSLTFKEFGDFIIHIDHRLGSSDDIISDLKHNTFYYNEHFNHMYNQTSGKSIESLFDPLDILKWCTFVVNTEFMISSLIYSHKRDYDKFFSLYDSNIKDLSFLKQPDKDLYILKDCLFVVKDLSILDQLKSNNFEVNKGPKTTRNQLNSINSFLSLLDFDIRDSLYKLQINMIYRYIIPKNVCLSRSKYSFKNIHNNIGNIRLYHTSSCLNLMHKNQSKNITLSRSYSTEAVSENISDDITTNSIYKNRDKLFQSNYTLIRDILEKNHYVVSESIQEEIELILRNQENLYSKDNIRKTKINFNDTSYNFIINKYDELLKLFSNYNFEGNIKFENTKYKPIIGNLIKSLQPEKIADLVLAFFMEILSNESIIIVEKDIPGIASIKAFDKFGKRILDKAIFLDYIKLSEKERLKITLSEFKDKYTNFNEIYKDEAVWRIGGEFVWSLVVIGLIKEVVGKHPDNSKHTVLYLKVDQKVRELLISNNCFVYHLPQKLPMVCEPKKYKLNNNKKLSLGGYLLNDKNFIEDLIKDRVGYGEKTTIKDKNMIINMVNDLSKIPYKVNVDTLKYIFEFGLNKNIILDESNSEVLSYIKNPYIFKSEDSNRLKSIISKILTERNILSIAYTYANVEKIYFPVRLDFRTRIYCKTDYFDYQKSDLAKGLISFANPGYIHKFDCDKIKYFKAYGANMFGHKLDKKSLNYRVKWIDDNTESILNFRDNDIINQAENKVCFISFCLEYIKFIDFINNKNSVRFDTYLPIQLDATCNGYQHLAMLTKETNLLKKLNLDVSSHDDDPQDFYTYLLDNTRDYINNYMKEITNEIKSNKKLMKSKDISSDTLDKLTLKQSKNQSNLESIKKLIKVDLNRSIVKKVSMRESYSAGVTKLVDTVVSDLVITKDGKKCYYSLPNSNIKLTRKDISVYVLCLKRVVEIIAPKIIELSKYLNSIVIICTRLDIPVPWTLPSGAEVKESYLKQEDKQIKAFTFNKSNYTFKKFILDKYDLRKQKRAIRPNLIHSLDATTIAMLYNDLNNIPLYTVHDCFAVTADNVPLLINKLNVVYMKLYSSSGYLTKFDNNIKTNINNMFGDKTYKMGDKYIYIPYKNDIKKVLFPDVSKVITYNDNIDITNILKSSYTLI